MSSDPSLTRKESSRKCPICQRVIRSGSKATETDARQFLPFCSQRCQQVDLMRWLDGKYTIVDDVSGFADDELPDSQQEE